MTTGSKFRKDPEMHPPALGMKEEHLKIAMLTDGIAPFSIGGMQAHSTNLLSFLLSNRVRVSLFYTAPEEQEAIARALPVFTDFQKQFLKAYFVPNVFHGRIPGHYLRESAKLSKAYLRIYHENKVDADFIYAQGFTGWSFVGKNLDLPPVGVNLHGLEMFQPAYSLKAYIEKMMLRFPARTILKEADVIFSFGGKIMHLTHLLKGPDSRVFKSNNFIAQDWLRPDISSPTESKPFTFIFIGRNERRKGIPELNEALKMIPANCDFRFIFVGELHDKLKMNDKRIEYIGRITEKETIKAYLDMSDVLVTPSLAEGMPTVILEAMGRGLAIIATDVGAVSEMVNSSNGFLIQPGKPEKIANAMKAFLDMHPEKLDTMKAASLLMSRDFILAKEGNVLLEQISEYIQKKKEQC